MSNNKCQTVEYIMDNLAKTAGAVYCQLVLKLQKRYNFSVIPIMIQIDIMYLCHFTNQAQGDSRRSKYVILTQKLIPSILFCLNTKCKGDRYHVPEFPHSSATFNIISGFCILASPKVLQGAFGDSACPMQCSQPCPMLANRHLTGLTWFPIVLYYIK